MATVDRESIEYFRARERVSHPSPVPRLPSIRSPLLPGSIFTCLVLATVLFATVAKGQDAQPSERSPLPGYGSTGGFDATYPVRLVTIESGRGLERGRGHAGFGDTRYAPFDRIEIVTDTIRDVIGVANAGIKVLALRPAGDPLGGGHRTLLRVVRRLSTGRQAHRGVVPDAPIPRRRSRNPSSRGGWRARPHELPRLNTGHHAIESEFGVTDSIAGGGGSVRFLDGEDVSTMWGVDHQVIDTRLLVLLEAGYSWALERGRIGLGIDTGSQHMRVVVGVMYPGVKTDLATEPTDLVVTPALSVHWRF